MEPTSDPAQVFLDRIRACQIEIDRLEARQAELMMGLLLRCRSQADRDYILSRLPERGPVNYYLCERTSLRRRSA